MINKLLVVTIIAVLAIIALCAVNDIMSVDKSRFGVVIGKQKEIVKPAKSSISRTHYCIVVRLRESVQSVMVEEAIHNALRIGDKVILNVREGRLFGDKVYRYIGRQVETTES